MIETSCVEKRQYNCEGWKSFRFALRQLDNMIIGFPTLPELSYTQYTGVLTYRLSTKTETLGESRVTTSSRHGNAMLTVEV
jgi:hypothetical protein